MTTREKRLLVVLGIFAGFGAAFGLWFLVATPYQESRDQGAKLQDDFDTKRKTLETLERQQSKLKGLMARSLPGDADVARREYESMLSALLRASNVPGGYTVTAKDPGDANRVIALAAKRPAYNRIGYEIVLRKVDLPTTVKFLEAYYKQPVLQQITRFNIKRAAGETSEAVKRADLEVTIATEGVIIDGAEKRQTLVPVSAAFTALGGGLGLGLLQNSPQVARHLSPGVLPSLLAANRDYALLAAKDLFHGPLPAIKTPTPKTETVKPVEVAKAEPPREDLSPHIRLTGITWRSDGSVVAEILDMANKHDYEVSRSFGINGVMKVRVKKFFYINTDRKPLESFDDLVIAEDGTATDRKFKVLDFTGDGLVLSETPLVLPPKSEEPATDATAGTKSSGKTSSKTSGKKPTAIGPQAGGALSGAIAFVPVKLEVKRYLWRIGSPLSKLEPLAPPGGEPVKSVEAMPMPRLEK